jgi:nucleotide-diphospho-sugar transferase
MRMQIITVATGNKYRACLAELLEGIAKFNTVASVICLSDTPISGHETILVPADCIGYQSRRIKTRLDKYAADGMNLYLDADIHVLRSLDGIWDELRDYDLAMMNEGALGFDPVTQCATKSTPEEFDLMRSMWLRGSPYFNAGIMLWRHCDITVKLFKTWHEEWLRFQRIDQPAFYRAMREVKPRIRQLNHKFHATPATKHRPDTVLSHRWIGGGQ